MFRIHLSFGDLENEQEYINKKINSNYHLSNIYGAFYQFKKASIANDNKIFIEVVPRNYTPKEDNTIDILANKRVLFSSVNKLYYSFRDPNMNSFEIEQNNFALLNYYKNNLTKIQFWLYFFILIILIFFGINSAKSSSFETNRINLLLMIIFALTVIGYFKISKKSKQYIKFFSTLTNQKTPEFDLRFIVQISPLYNNETKNIEEVFSYLGIWEYRFTKGDTSYFYIRSNHNEEQIKQELSNYFHNSKRINVTSTLSLFPIGYI